MKLFKYMLPRIFATGALVVSMAMCVGCASTATSEEANTNSTALEVSAEETVASDDSNGEKATPGELAPLTEDIYFQGSAEPANEPYTEGKDPRKIAA